MEQPRALNEDRPEALALPVTREPAGINQGLFPIHSVLTPASLAMMVFAACLMATGEAAVSGAPAARLNATEQADRYYRNRENLDNVRKAISILRDEVQADPGGYEAWWRIAEYDCYLARHLPGKEPIPVLEDGVEAGKRAEQLRPQRPEGHFWTGADEGLLGEHRGLWGGLLLVDPVRNEMQTVLKLDPEYQEDGAERILGRLYYEAPFFKGGDKALSIRLLEHCLQRYPNNSFTMLYLADSYRATGRPAEARAMLERILTIRPDPGDRLDVLDNQADARRELKKYFHERQ
jgi:cytochrome c-type biogenesis protein CcmH/NrfG